VQDEFGRAGAGGLDFLVEAGRLPLLQPLRFARDQIGFHGKAGLRQIERVFVIGSQDGLKNAECGRQSQKRVWFSNPCQRNFFEPVE
jgi:hypothetical protein